MAMGRRRRRQAWHSTGFQMERGTGTGRGELPKVIDDGEAPAGLLKPMDAPVVGVAVDH